MALGSWFRKSGEITETVMGPYLGRIEGWTLRPPYSAPFRILDGTNRPNDTAMMRLMGSPCDLGSWSRSISRFIMF